MLIDFPVTAAPLPSRLATAGFIRSRQSNRRRAPRPYQSPPTATRLPVPSPCLHQRAPPWPRDYINPVPSPSLFPSTTHRTCLFSRSRDNHFLPLFASYSSIFIVKSRQRARIITTIILIETTIFLPTSSILQPQNGASQRRRGPEGLRAAFWRAPQS